MQSMVAKRPNRTTIVITPDVRDVLKHMARKDQSYTEIIKDLIKLRNASCNKEENGSGEPTQNLSQSQNLSHHESSGANSYD